MAWLRRSGIPVDRAAAISSVALFTADWTAFDQREDICTLDAILASKLCDLNGVSRLIEYLCTRESVLTSGAEAHTSRNEDAPTGTAVERSRGGAHLTAGGNRRDSLSSPYRVLPIRVA